MTEPGDVIYLRRASLEEGFYAECSCGWKTEPTTVMMDLAITAQDHRHETGHQLRHQDPSEGVGMKQPKKYRKKPVVIEALQWWEDGDHSKVGLYRYPPIDIETGEISASDDAVSIGELKHSEVFERFRRETCDAIMDDHGWVDTLEGGHTVCPGDWIICGIQGEFYPCKPDIFEATYDEVGEHG